MTTQMTEDEKVEKICNYGMMVSALHDLRYFNPVNAYESKATPYNCPEDIKNILIERYGDNWKDGFWEKGYDSIFPDVKILHEERTGIKSACAVLPTAAEARQQVIENLDGEPQKQFNTIAEQIKEAIVKRQTQLVTDIRGAALLPAVRAKLESFGYRLDHNGCACWIIFW